MRLIRIKSIYYIRVVSLFIFFVFCYSIDTSSQPDVRFRKLNISLSDNSVHCIFEDHKGFMWFGTESGLDRFDGIKVTSYSIIIGNDHSISNNKVKHVFEDSKKNLWVGTANGLNLYSRAKDSFIRYYFKGDEKNKVLCNNINTIIEDVEGAIWLGTHGGVCLVDKENKQIVPFKKFTGSNTEIGHEIIQTLMQDNQKRIFAGSMEGNIYQYEKQTGRITKYLFDNGKVELDIALQIFDINQTEDGIIWINTIGGGLFKVKKMKDGHIWYDNFRHNPDDKNSLINDNLQAICFDNKGDFWLSTVNGGLNKYDSRKNIFIKYQYDPFNSSSISGNSVWDMFIDSKDRLWVSVFNSGINIADKSTEKFVSYKRDFSDNSLTHSSITAFVEDFDKNMWIATDGGGLDFWDRKTDKFVHYRHKKNDPGSILSDVILSLFMTKKGDLWAGSFEGGISVLERGKTKFKHITQAHGLPPGHIFDILQGKDDIIYIGGYYGGLSLYNERTKKIANYKHNKGDSGISDNRIVKLCLDSDNDLWIGFAEKGVDLMTYDENGELQFTNFSHEPNDPFSLSDNSIMTIFEDSKKNVWIATRGGLNKFNKKTQKFVGYSKQNGFPHSTIVGIQEDNNGKLWVSSLNGLSCFDPETEEIKNYAIDDGLQGMLFNNRSAYNTNKKGEMFFGGDNGFTVFHPDSLQYDNDFPRIYFSDFKIFNKRVEIGAKGSPLKSHIRETKEITLSYKQSIFTIEYIALNYSHTKKTQYAYKLDGLETKWNYVGSKRTATYTNLDAGEYTFRVKSTNNEGDWNEECTMLKITITPPFWETWWFVAIELFVIIFGALVFYRIKINNIKTHNEKLEALVKERTLELSETNTSLEEKQEEILKQNEELGLHRNHLEDLVEERTNELLVAKEKAEESDKLKTSFLTNMSHEIRTPLNAIVGYSSLLEDSGFDTEANPEFINYIRKNSDLLLDLVDNILDLAKIETTKLQVERKIFNVSDFLNDVYTYWNLNNYSLQVKLRQIDNEYAKGLFINSDKYRIRQILNNLVSNALKFTEEGYVDIGCKTGENTLTFYVKDSGIGISARNCKVIFESFRKIEEDKAKLYRGTGMGLAISRRLSEIIGGRLWVDSKPGEGSIFYFSLPYNPNDSRENKKSKSKQSKTVLDWKGKRVLIVEDDRASMLYLKQVLKKIKVEASWVINGKAAVELFQTGEKFDLVLMDIKMPILDGYEATMLIKEISPNQVIIAQTAYAKGGSEKSLMEAGFDGFLSKPIKSRHLLNLLEKYFN